MTKTDSSSNVSNHLDHSLEYWNKGGFALCTAGWADVRINDKIYHLTEGSVFVITPLVHFFEIDKSDDFDKISFVNDLKVFYPIFKLISDTSIPLKVSKNPSWVLSEKESQYVKEQQRRIDEKLARIASTQSSDELQMLTHLVNLIRQETMLEIVSNHVTSFDSSIDSIRNGSIAYRFILALHENYRNERSVSWYASQANMSTGHFSAIIREATGQTPSDWISSVTTNYAKLLLEQTDKSIKEIANELNFPEQFTFRKYFKRYTGLSPSDYRNELR